MIVKFEEVAKEYRLGKTTVHALNNISLEVQQGEFIALVGPSGSGKSTALHLMGALDRPSSGSVYIKGTKINDMNDKELAVLRRDTIGFIFQSFNLIPVLSVFENVEFPLMLKKVPKTERNRRVTSVLLKVGLEKRMNHKTEELSGGERQRVAIARALVTDPSILLSDEPTANLDSKIGTEIIELMQTLNRDQNVTLIFATHDDSIIKKAKRTIRIRDGKLQNGHDA